MSRIDNNLSTQQTQQAQQAQEANRNQTQAGENSAFAKRLDQAPKQDQPKATPQPQAQANSSPSQDASTLMMQRQGASIMSKRGGGNTVADLQAQLESTKGQSHGKAHHDPAMGEGGSSLESMGKMTPFDAKNDLKILDNLVDKSASNLSNDAASLAAGQAGAQAVQGQQPGAVSEVIQVQGNRIPTQMLDKIVDQARVGVNAAGNAEFQFDLKGDVLGGLQMKMSMEDGKLKAVFMSENPEVRKFIDGNLKDLQKQLEDRGIYVKDLEVRDPKEEHRQQQNEQNRKQRQEAMDM